MKIYIFLFYLIYASQALFAHEQIIIGSKRFTESYILGEILRCKLKNNTQHKKGMGGTLILWQALQKGSIQAYPEYTGTIKEVLLKSPQASDLELKHKLANMGIGLSQPLGFNNTYALAVKKSLNLQKISDLQNNRNLRFGLSHEFRQRQDGWQPLKEIYKIPSKNIKALDQSLAYLALKENQVDIIDVSSTDAKIQEFNLKLLEDDLKFFPEYQAVFLYRLDANQALIEAIDELSGKIAQNTITKLNYTAEKNNNYTQAAQLFLGQKTWLKEPSEVFSYTFQHLKLVVFSLFLAIFFGIPLGILISLPRASNQIILAFISIIQTVPSLALLALLVPILGISSFTAIVALFFYSLLPIVKNTASGLQNIPQNLRESAEALGLEPKMQFLKIFLPLASRSILAGIKTSAIINIGNATLAALIGAGGLGEPILSGLNLNDHKLILQGAIPSAFLALLTQFIFELIDKKLMPKSQ